MNTSARTRWVCEKARDAGFDLCGVAPVEGWDELDRFPEWLERGYAGEMNYLKDARRGDPRLVLADARSLVVVALNYNSPQPYSTRLAGRGADDKARGWISRYAWGDDYHEVIRDRLDALASEMRLQFGGETRVYVDTGPVIERVAAKYAGLGWLAKNTCLINQQLGSWLFLGVIMTTVALDPTIAAGAAPPPDLCGSCTRCLDACPTQAFPEPYVLDARRCVSYLTIELRGSIPEELRPGMGNAVIGCDICQDVCPWNRKAPVTGTPDFHPRTIANVAPEGSSPEEPQRSLFAPELEWLASLTQEEFSAVFRRSAAKRAKWRGLIRNTCVALGNTGAARNTGDQERVVALLQKLATSGDATIAEHARWALDRIRTNEKTISVRN